MSIGREYTRFHGRPPDRVKKLDFQPPRALVLLGKARAIEYECSKLAGGGDGTRAIYRHLFKPGDMLYADQTMKRQLYIIGRRLKVTAAGIEG